MKKSQQQTLKPKSQPIPAPPPAKEVIAAALNEQGYLLHHKVLSVLELAKHDINSGHSWIIDASEVPVSLPNDKETRIDIVLRYGGEESMPWRVVLECKRAARDYKRWIFFSDGVGGLARPKAYHKCILRVRM